MDNETEQTELLDPQLMPDDDEDQYSPVIKLAGLPGAPNRTRQQPRRQTRTTKRLLLIHSENSTIRYPLHKREMTIGRSSHADIEVHGRYISRVHALIRVQDDSSVIIEDVGSKNGVLVNGEICDCRILQHADSILIGQVRLEYQEPDEATELA